jgi:hypothetical protein
MAAEFISRKTPFRCIFFLSTLRACSTLLSRTRTCTRRSSSIERLKGPMAKGPGPLANGYAQSGYRWHPRSKAADTRMGFRLSLN